MLPKKEEVHNTLYYIKRCGQYFKPYTPRIVFSMVSMAIVGGCTAYSAFLVQPALDKIFINKNTEALKTIPLLVVAIFAVKGFFMLMQNYQMQYCAHRVLQELRDELYSKMLRLPVSFFEQNRVGMLMSRIINDVNLIRSSIPELIMLVRHVFTMIALIFVAFYRDAFLASLAVIVLPVALFPVVYFGQKLRKVGRKNQEKIADISTILQEIFSGIRVVKAFAMEGRETTAFKQQNEKLVKIALKGAFYTALSSPVMEFIGAIGIGVVIWYGGTQVIAGNSTPGTFFSFLTALLMLYEPFKRISKSNMVVQKAIAGAERVFYVLDSPDIEVEQQGRQELRPPFAGLRFEQVQLTYADSAEKALDQLSFELGAGERLAIVGPSGAGKTSLVNLIPRFYDPERGRIILNGHRLQDYTLESLRRFIGMVSQEAVLFNTSIRENITYGLQGIDDEQLHEVCSIAYASQFIQRLPAGLDTVIGERGIKLSGGEKQRLTIARALLKDPSLLILDEATSALDTESEKIVQKALENLMHQRTSIVIAHRLSTVLSADRIMVLKHGVIEDIGPHEQLLERCSLYQKLYKMQFENAETAPAEL
jgi:subfamily B ATP-binding cassette protein MsbA